MPHDDSIPCLVDYETREDCIVPAARKLKTGMIAVELGSYLGGSVCLLARHLREPNIKVYAIDNWKCENISQQSIDWSNLERHDQVYGEFLKNISTVQQFCLEKKRMENIITPIQSDTTSAANLFADKSVNYIFFDAAHGYQGLVDELKAWRPKFADNCFAFVHDAPSPDITRAIHDVFDLNTCLPVRGGSSIIIRNTL